MYNKNILCILLLSLLADVSLTKLIKAYLVTNQKIKHAKGKNSQN